MASRHGSRVRKATERYAADQQQVCAATDSYVALVTQLLDDAGINYLSVTGRAKSIESYAGKAARRVAGKPLYPDPVTGITDQIGVRVIAYVLADVDAVAQLLGDQLVLLDDRDMGRETAAEGRFGYSSRHLLVALDPARSEADGPMRGRRASIQVRTVLQHAWAEFEHDIRYKGSIPQEHVSDLDRRFTLAAGLLELADQQFSTIRDRLRREGNRPSGEEDADDPRISGQDLAAFLAGQFTDAGWSHSDHYTWVAAMLLELGITSLQELRDVLRGVADSRISDRMDYRYPPGAVRRLDDALLSVYGDAYVTLHGNAHRVDLLRARLARMTAEL